MTKRICPVCGAAFSPVNGRQRFCSRACTLQAKYKRDGARRSAARAAARANRTCPVCGTTFTPKNARGIYCSMRCANLANRKPVAHDPKPCAWCGTAFTPTRSNQIYCSRECNIAAHGKSRKGTALSIRQVGRAVPGEPSASLARVRAYLALPPDERWARRDELTQSEHKLAQKLYLENHAIRTVATNDLMH